MVASDDHPNPERRQWRDDVRFGRKRWPPARPWRGSNPPRLRAAERAPARPGPAIGKPGATLAAAETEAPSLGEAPATDATHIGNPGSDFMVDLLCIAGIEYVAAMPGSTFRGIHESIVNYAGDRHPQLIVCTHEEASAAMQAYVHAPAGQMPPYSARILSDADIARIHPCLDSNPANPRAARIALRNDGAPPAPAPTDAGATNARQAMPATPVPATDAARRCTPRIARAATATPVKAAWARSSTAWHSASASHPASCRSSIRSRSMRTTCRPWRVT